MERRSNSFLFKRLNFSRFFMRWKFMPQIYNNNEERDDVMLAQFDT
jgi:hypothetical protein